MIYGIDPDETWDVDYCLESIRLRVEEARAAGPGGAEALAAAERDRGEYAPGSGPVFRVGHPPSAKAYEIMGLAAENVGKPLGAEKLGTIYRWEREVVRWSVRGHHNLRFRRRDGTTAEVPFESAEVAGRPVVSDKTLEVYGASGLLGPLARMVYDAQRLSEPEKNA